MSKMRKGMMIGKAEPDHWDEANWEAIDEMLKKMRPEREEAGLEAWLESASGDARQSMPKMRAEPVGREYRLHFPFSERIRDEIKSRIPKRRWEPTEKKWFVPANRLADKVLAELGFALPRKDIDARFAFMEALGLRPYQAEGVRLLAEDFDLNGLLADEMGLGKTAQAICAIRARADEAFPVLAIVPASLKLNWEREIQKWHPEATVEIISGKPKGVGFERKADYTIINYDVLAPWADELVGKFNTVILDECHRIKNNKTMWTKAAKKIAKKAKFKLCLSGTPITNRPIEFYNVLKMLAPGTFGNWKEFGFRFCDGETKNIHGAIIHDFNGASNLAELHRLASAFMLRRQKKDVLQDLPEKNRIVIPVDIDQKKYQKAELDAMLNLDVLPAIEKTKQAVIEGKLPAAIDWIKDYLESGNKLVVFAHHVATLDALEKAFPHCERLDGSMSEKRRQEAVDSFQNDPGSRLFIGNLQAAGVGITLTAASATLTLELGWVPGEHLQAEDRVHRIGQGAGSVEAYYLVARDTIDEDIMGMLDKKMKNIGEIVDGKEIPHDDTMLALMREHWEEKKAALGAAKPKARKSGPKM